jgi:hypothetical protein
MEMTTLRFKNCHLQDRSIFVMHGQMVFSTRYHKSQSQMDKPKVIPRFLPWRVGQVLIGLQTGSSQGLRIRRQGTPRPRQQQFHQTYYNPLLQRQQQQRRQRQAPHMFAG